MEGGDASHARRSEFPTRLTRPPLTRLDAPLLPSPPPSPAAALSHLAPPPVVRIPNDAYPSRRPPTSRAQIGQHIVATHDGAAVRGSGECRSLFLHAGLRLSVIKHFASSLERLNSELRAQVRAGERSAALLDPHEGPLWWRGFARPHGAGLSLEEACREVRDTLASLAPPGDSVRRMVVGHNIVPFIASRCSGVLDMIDVGMSSAYEGRPAVWRCDVEAGTGAAKIQALYATGSERPPDLCEACSEVQRTGAHPIHGGDPHDDCLNYCPRSRAGGGSGGGGAGGISALWGAATAGSLGPQIAAGAAAAGQQQRPPSQAHDEF